MAISNPTKFVSVQRLGRFENKLAGKYATKAEVEAINVTCRGFSITYDAADHSIDITPLGNTEVSYDANDKSLNLTF